MNVLSLFDGISCGQVALNRLGIKYDKYFASEIDKYAIKVTQHNFPNTIQLGDVTKIKKKDSTTIDLLLGGSPCQGFSFAGKRLNFDDPRSKLFFEYVRLLKECKPKYFLLENVKMKKEYQDIISKELGVEPIAINSALVSAQDRKRLYWTNIPNVTQPENKHIYLKDILESTTDSEDHKVDFYRRGHGYLVDKHDRVEKCNALVVTSSDEYFVSQTDKSVYFKKYIVNAARKDRFDKILNKEKEENYIRKLTPIECERLQTLPDNYTNVISDHKRYSCIGNGWTVDVICHILKNMEI
jgi:DNA-cytosine methyltransferase